MRVSFVDGQVLMWPKGKTIDDVVVIGEQEGGLYKLKAQPEQALVHDSVEPNELWNRRLAHVHYRALPLASKVVEGLLEMQTKHDGVTKDVQKERTQRRHFQVVRERKKESWKSSSSLSGYVYYVCFIDDFSRKTLIYFMKNKDELFNKFKEFKDLIKNHIEKKINIFRSDNGGEFTSNEFKELCNNQGLRGSYPFHIIHNRMGL